MATLAERGWTLRLLGAEMGVNSATIWAWRHGHSTPDAEQARALALLVDSGEVAPPSRVGKRYPEEREEVWDALVELLEEHGTTKTARLLGVHRSTPLRWIRGWRVLTPRHSQAILHAARKST